MVGDFKQVILPCGTAGWGTVHICVCVFQCFAHLYHQIFLNILELVEELIPRKRSQTCLYGKVKGMTLN